MGFLQGILNIGLYLGRKVISTLNQNICTQQWWNVAEWTMKDFAQSSKKEIWPFFWCNAGFEKTKIHIGQKCSMSFVMRQRRAHTKVKSLTTNNGTAIQIMLPQNHNETAISQLKMKPLTFNDDHTPIKSPVTKYSPSRMLLRKANLT